MAETFDWSRLEKLEAAVAWRREEGHEPLANVWHLETVADLVNELRRLLIAREVDERLISLLWANVPGDNRSDVVAELRAAGTRHPGGDERLASVIAVVSE